MEKHVYIVISQTGTLLSRILKLVTKAEYNHASISLVPDLSTMYSFGRKNPYNPFWAGFVTESARFGTFKRFSKTRILVLDITVSEEQYLAIQRRIQTMLTLKEHYHYNYLGLWLAGLRICYRQTVSQPMIRRAIQEARSCSGKLRMERMILRSGQLWLVRLLKR